ncbi:hypothetical protein BN946_scf185043.g29 [Trametes cinnabarina]|uniref:HAT C-terminal dimerisation domain-containing protein n=1 Tax=Pycnoporus cinnabarinus TaxID=5643 RepID=A0A060SHV2_PYCCI|nr:hypothetical protein BN946_scf185043.g29 [Trametes cinnabarina]
MVLARIREVQAANGKSASAVIRPVATRWTSHYLAFKRLLELQPSLAAILASDRVAGGDTTFMAGIKGSAAKAKARQMLALIKDGPFWHSLNWMKLHLEPFAIAANVAQAAHCRLDQVLLIFGFLYHQFSHLPSDLNDDVASSAVLKSLENCWSRSLPEFVVMKLEDLLVQLWKCLFRANSDLEVPPELYQDISLYFDKKGWFSDLDDLVNKKLERARIMNVSVDPLDIWNGLKVLDSGPRPLAMLAHRLLSVCANLASCERLFSIFGQLLTKPRNRLGSTTLSALAELKMHLHDEYPRSQGMKERLRRHCGKPQDETSATQGPVVANSALPATRTTLSPDETTSGVPTQEESPAATPPGELCAISDELTRAHNEDADTDSHHLSAQYTSANGRDRPFSRTLVELFNFDSPLWIARIEVLASRGLDQELALYELLDLDAAGESVGNESDSRDEADDLSELNSLTAEILHA